MTDQIIGNDIFLRRITREDTDTIIKWRNSDFVRKNFIDQRLFTEESHLYWYENIILKKKAEQFIIVDQVTKMEYGSVYLRDIDYTHKKAEFGIFIGEKNTLGKGIGTKAGKLLLQYAFEQLNLHKIFLRVLAENTLAIECYKKIGFSQEGYLKEEVLMNERYMDLVWMASINS